MMKKTVWLILSCLMALSLVLASCGGTTTPEEEEEEVIVPGEEEEEEEEEEVIVPEEKGPKYGGTITINSGQAISSPNPMQGSPGIISVTSNTHNRLGVADWTKGPAGTGELSLTNGTMYLPYVGALAESWEQTDPYTFIIHLRQGVHFHDMPPVNGREFTADDVVYSITSLLAHPEIQTHINPMHQESITATDKYTVELKANTLDTRFLMTYLIGPNTWIRPPEIETYGVGSTDINTQCGTGPFVLIDFVSSSSSTFERNPDYWGYDEINTGNQLPYVDGVKILQISEKSTYMAALRTGKLDMLGMVSVNDAGSLQETSPELEYLPYLSNMFKKFSMRQDLEELPYSDVRVRKALSMAIDREAIIEGFLKGKGEILTYPLNPTDMKEVYIPLEELPESTREQFDYNPEKARQLLADAGYPSGFQAECLALENEVEYVQIFVSYWKAIGVDVEIQVVDRGAWFNLVWGKKYEQMSFGTSGTSNPLYTLEERMTDAYFNYDMHFDPEYDAKMAMLIEITDEAERNRMVQELALSWLGGVNCIQFPGEYSYSFWWPWIKNYHGETALGWHGGGAINARVWVDQELKKEMGY